MNRFGRVGGPGVLLPLAIGLGLVSIWSDARAADRLLPPNGWLTWSSNRSGKHEIYLKKVGSDQAVQLSDSGGNYPMWSPDGQWISYYDTTNGWTTIIRPDGGGKKKICNSHKHEWVGSGQFWMYDGSGLVCSEGDTYHLYDPKTDKRVELFSKDDFDQLKGYSFAIGSISKDGKWVAGYTNLFNGQSYKAANGTFGDMAWAAIFLNIDEDSDEYKWLYFLGKGCEPTFSPTENTVYHVCSGDCDNPTDIVQLDLADRKKRDGDNDGDVYREVISYPDGQWGHEYYPRISNDGHWLAYSAALEHSGNYNVFIHKLDQGVKQREIVVDDDKHVDNFPHLFVGTPYGIECSGPGDCPSDGPCSRPLCQAFKCAYEAVSGCCENAADCPSSDNPCTELNCDTAKHQCVSTQKPDCCQRDEDCADPVSCTVDRCDTETGTCSNLPAEGCCVFDIHCEDKDPCTQNICLDDNSCDNPPINNCCITNDDCVDEDMCNADICDNNRCTHPPIQDCCESDGGCEPTGDAGPTHSGSDAGVDVAATGSQEPDPDDTGSHSAVARDGSTLLGGCTMRPRPSLHTWWVWLALLALLARPRRKTRPR